MLLLLAGGLALVLEQGPVGNIQLLGPLAVLAATAAWGVETRFPGALRSVTLGKWCWPRPASVPASPLCSHSWRASPPPGVVAAGALLAVGATGYGLSLRLYLHAQREFGAGRTGSVFAFAPFIGALGALALGDRSATWMVAGSGVLMLVGVVLHLAQSHSHSHEPDSLEHEHAHTHDDARHLHTHDDMPTGKHSHWHHHAPTLDTHSHVPDAHHLHPH